MSKYEPLPQFLGSVGGAAHRMTFAEIERILGFKLPKSAYEHEAWWSNNATGHSHARAWLKFGWRTEAVDLAALPLIATVAGAVWILATPLRHAESRRQERLADALALVLTGGADAFGAAIRRLGERRLAEERPSTLTRWLFHRHPSVKERLAMAETYRQSGSRLET